jgi:hypothetical protein
LTIALSTASYFAPDGNVYFFDQSSRDILEFNAASPTSLSIAASNPQISAVEGGGTPAVSNLTWYNGYIAWDNVNAVGQGVYAEVPEPGSLSLLGIASLGLLRRRRR